MHFCRQDSEGTPHCAKYESSVMLDIYQAVDSMPLTFYFSFSPPHPWPRSYLPPSTPPPTSFLYPFLPSSLKFLLLPFLLFSSWLLLIRVIFCLLVSALSLTIHNSLVDTLYSRTENIAIISLFAFWLLSVPSGSRWNIYLCMYVCMYKWMKERRK